MSQSEMDAEIDRAVAAAKVAAGLDPRRAYPPIEFHEHIEERLARPFWHRHTRRALDQMIRDADPATPEPNKAAPTAGSNEGESDDEESA